MANIRQPKPKSILGSITATATGYAKSSDHARKRVEALSNYKCQQLL